MLRRLVIDGKPDYFAVVFDAPAETFRDDWYPNTRPTVRDARRPVFADPAAARPRARARFAPLVMVEGVEADDVIGTLARRRSAAASIPLISTSDKDLAQLVGAGVKLDEHDDDERSMTRRRRREVRRPSRSGARPADVDGRFGRQRSRRTEGGPRPPRSGSRNTARSKRWSRTRPTCRRGRQNLRQTLEWLPQGRSSC